MFFFFGEDENMDGVPGFEQTLKPILKALQERGGKSSVAELDKAAIRIMGLPEDVMKKKHKGSAKRSEMEYRMAWGRTYLKKYGLINNETRGVWAFTDKFDGNIEGIDADQIVQKVRRGSVGNEEENIFETATAFENMVGALLREMADKEGKQVKERYSDYTGSEYDLVFPSGFGDIKEEIKCYIKYVHSSKQDAYFFNEICKKIIDKNTGKGKVLLITNIAIPEKMKGSFGQNVFIWDKRDLLEYIEPDAPYAQYLINPKQALIEDVVTGDQSVQRKTTEREGYLKQAKEAFLSQDMVLFLGAGVSIDGGIPLWSTLIKTLHVYMLNRLTEDKGLSIRQKEMINELAANNEMESPLMQMRYIKAAFSDEEYYELVRSALYGQEINLNTDLLNAIAKICTPQRTYCGIKSVVTYNFDDLLEMKLTEKEIKYHVISDERERQSVDKLNVYHVHGYLPSDISQISDEPNLVFSEEDYHRVYRDSYSWSNLVQLSALRDNICLFIGCSLSDPNLRRLLDAAARNGESPRHFAILKKEEAVQKQSTVTYKDVLELYKKIDNNIKTAYYKTLGLNIIWIDDYKEIPDILNGFLK